MCHIEIPVAKGSSRHHSSAKAVHFQAFHHQASSALGILTGQEEVPFSVRSPCMCTLYACVECDSNDRFIKNTKSCKKALDFIHWW